MHIQSITLENFRCFEKLSLELHPRLNVFLGENGAGKSSVLSAFEIMLGYAINCFCENKIFKSTIDNLSIKFGEQNSKISITAITAFDKEVLSWNTNAQRAINLHKKSIDETCSVTYTLSKENEGVASEFACSGLQSYANKIQFSNNAPILVSYAASRNLCFAIIESKDQIDLGVFSCYKNAIGYNNSFDEFFIWFKEREDIENENFRNHVQRLYPQQKGNRNIFSVEGFKDTQLQSVRDALQSFFPDFTNFTVKRKTYSFVATKNNVEHSIEQFSDGEKIYLLLVADIARRLAIANPALDKPLEGSGVILIDEIELHLHPKWQREIIPGLLKTFPNCQFIVTSHSPQVLGEIEDINSIWILEEGQEPYHPSRAYGMESSELLREVMGAASRNAYVSKELEEIDRLIGSEQFEKARSAIQELAQKTGEIPAIISANSYLTMMGQEQAEIEE